jgi:hypothetical protein
MIKTFADKVGIDPWDIDPVFVRRFIQQRERSPISRYAFGSPCKLIRKLDAFVHVVLPEMLYEKHPIWACYLRSTSPRWGRSWRNFNTTRKEQS